MLILGINDSEKISRPREEKSIINEAIVIGIGIRNGKRENNLSLKRYKDKASKKVIIAVPETVRKILIETRKVKEISRRGREKIWKRKTQIAKIPAVEGIKKKPGLRDAKPRELAPNHTEPKNIWISWKRI